MQSGHFLASFGTRSQISCLLSGAPFHIPRLGSRRYNLTLLLLSIKSLGELFVRFIVCSPANPLTPGSLVFCPYPFTQTVSSKSQVHSQLSSSSSNSSQNFIVLATSFFWKLSPPLTFPILFSCCLLYL